MLGGGGGDAGEEVAAVRKYAQCSTRDLSGAAATTEVVNSVDHMLQTCICLQGILACSHTNAHLQKQTACKL